MTASPAISREGKPDINSENETDNRVQLGAFPPAESPSRAAVAERANARAAATINPDTMIYFVQVRLRSGLPIWAERDPANMSRRDTIADLKTGDLANVVTILECNPVENICNNVTDDMLAEAGVVVEIDAPITGQDRIDWQRDRVRAMKESV